MSQSQEISTKMPYETKYVTVSVQNIRHKMAYVEAGRKEGDPILFLHGNPVSKYLWRNIMPHLECKGMRVIAPDLIGMGESDKPHKDDCKFEYSYHDHYAYLSAFIDKVVLNDDDEDDKAQKKITFVLHDWGSGLGFHYCHQHPHQVKAIAFMEAFVRPVRCEDWPADLRFGFSLMRAPIIGYLWVQVGNMLVKYMLPRATTRKLRPEEQAVYEAPFADVASRKPLLMFPRSIPIDGHPQDVHDIMEGYSHWLQDESQSGHIPKLMLVAQPGALITESVATWAENNFTNLTRVDIGNGIHFVQEDCPHVIGEEIAEWYERI